mmetsp:Transcript_46344/g.108170  ORF Transcript_46344/g.108170 Transcript_46344/m.108170 type:complete len:200 (+) Transcript_46344:209-808(+)
MLALTSALGADSTTSMSISKAAPSVLCSSSSFTPSARAASPPPTAAATHVRATSSAAGSSVLSAEVDGSSPPSSSEVANAPTARSEAVRTCGACGSASPDSSTCTVAVRCGRKMAAALGVSKSSASTSIATSRCSAVGACVALETNCSSSGHPSVGSSTAPSAEATAASARRGEASGSTPRRASSSALSCARASTGISP